MTVVVGIGDEMESDVDMVCDIGMSLQLDILKLVPSIQLPLVFKRFIRFAFSFVNSMTRFDVFFKSYACPIHSIASMKYVNTEKDPNSPVA